MSRIVTQHPTLVHHKKIQKLCSPLSKLNISYFSCAHFNKNSEFTSLCSHPEFYEHYYNREYFKHDLHTADTRQFGKYVLWDAIPRAGETSQMGVDAKSAGIGHTFTIIERHAEGESFYHFATHVENSLMNQVFLDNINLLKMFINHFENSVRSSSDLSKFSKLKTKIDLSTSGYITQPKPEIVVSAENRNAFLSELKIDNSLSQLSDISESGQNNLLTFQYEIIKKTHQALSQREAQCLYYTLQGKSAREVGSQLHISQRTVEHYLILLKDKFYCKNKSELVEKALKFLQGNVYAHY